MFMIVMFTFARSRAVTQSTLEAYIHTDTAENFNHFRKCQVEKVTALMESCKCVAKEFNSRPLVYCNYTQYLLIRNGVNFRLVRFLFFPDFYTIFVSYFSHFIQSPFLKNLSKNENMLKNCNIWWNFE